MRTVGGLTLVLCVVLGSPGHSREEKDPSGPLQGTWIPIKGELGGKAFPSKAFEETKLLIKGTNYRVEVSGETDEGTLKLMTAKKPWAMDITGVKGPTMGKTLPCIYDVKGDTLTVCYDLEGKERPRAFKTEPKTQQFLIIYKRSKP